MRVRKVRLGQLWQYFMEEIGEVLDLDDVRGTYLAPSALVAIRACEVGSFVPFC